MAQNVGSVEIDVDVDTRNMDRDMEKAADRAAQVYGKRFSKTAGGELNSLFSKSGARLRTEAAKAGGLAGDGFADNLTKMVEKRVKAWDLDISQGIVFGEWRKALSTFDDVDEGVKRVTARLEFLRKEGQLTGAQFTDSAKALADWVAEARKLDAAAKAQERYQQAMKDSAAEIAAGLKAQERLSKIREKDAGVAKRIVSGLEAVAKAQKKVNDNDEKSYSILGRLSGSRNNLLHMIGNLARAFEGLPKLVGGTARALGGFASTLGDAFNQGKGFGKVTNVLRTGISGVAKSFGRLAAANPVGLLAGLLAALYQVGFVGNLLTSLAGGISGLSGIVLALASSIGYALGGALLSLGPILGSVAAGVGAVTLAVKSNKEAFEDAVRPVTDWADAVGEVVSDALLPKLSDAADDLAGTLKNSVTPILRETGDAVGDFALAFADELGSDRMKSNMKVFENTWPNILRNLGDVFTSIFAGIAGVLAAISPQVEDITDGFADSAEKFAIWANSTEGQKSIKNFFTEAWEAAKDLWAIIKNIGTVLGAVFGEGKDTGDDFLGSLRDITEEFATWAKSPEGQKEIRQFFKDAKSLAKDLWGLVKEVGQEFDKWDTSETRKDFGDILNFARALVGVLGQAVRVADGIWESLTFQEGSPAQGWINDTLFGGKTAEEWFNEDIVGWWEGTAVPFFNGMWETIGPAQGWNPFSDWWNTSVVPWWDNTVYPFFQNFGPNVMGGLTTGLQGAWTGFVGFWQGLWNGLVSTVQEIFGIASPSTVFASIGTDIINGLIQGIQQTWANVKAWWTTVAVPWFQGLPAKVGGWFGQMWGQMTAGIGKGWAKVKTWWTGTAVPWFKGLPSRVGGWFSNMWGKFAEGIGKGWAKVKTWWSSTAVPWFKGLPQRVATWFSNMWDKFTSGIGDGWQKVKNWWSNTAVPWFKGLPGKVTGYFEDMWDEMVETAKGLPGKIRSWWNTTGWPNIKSIFTDTDWASLGADMIEGIINGITPGSLGSALRGAVNSAVADAKAALGINSPSKVTMRELGMPMGEGVAVGIDQASRMVHRSMAGLLGVSGGVANVLRAANSGGGNVNPRKSDSVQSGLVRQLVVAEGAIVVNAPQANPRLVAAQVLDRLVRSNVG